MKNQTNNALTLIFKLINAIDPSLTKELDIQSNDTDCKVNLTTKDGYHIYLTISKGKIKLDQSDKIQKALELRELGWSQNRIAKVIGMSQKWVSLTLKNNS
jgi:hypothetical protein